MIIERTLIRDTDPLTLHCGRCGRPMRHCACVPPAEQLILHFLTYVPIVPRERLIRFLALEWGIEPRLTRIALGYLLRSGAIVRVSHGKYALGNRRPAELPTQAERLTNGLLEQARG